MGVKVNLTHPMYISLVVLHKKQTRRHENDFTAHGYDAP
jgi:hypothetical protein